LFWHRTTDTATFAGLAVGFVLPIVFVLTTGTLQAATVVGFVPTVVPVGTVSVLSATGRLGDVVTVVTQSGAELSPEHASRACEKDCCHTARNLAVVP
jgi:Na+/proline symporter